MCILLYSDRIGVPYVPEGTRRRSPVSATRRWPLSYRRFLYVQRLKQGSVRAARFRCRSRHCFSSPSFCLPVRSIFPGVSKSRLINGPGAWDFINGGGLLTQGGDYTMV